MSDPCASCGIDYEDENICRSCSFDWHREPKHQMNLIDQRYVDVITGSCGFQILVLHLELKTLMDEILAAMNPWARWLFEKHLAVRFWISRRQRALEVWKIKRRWRKQMRIS